MCKVRSAWRPRRCSGERRRSARVHRSAAGRKVPESVRRLYNRSYRKLSHAAARGNLRLRMILAADAHAALKRLNAVALKKLTLQNISRAGARFTQNQALGNSSSSRTLFLPTVILCADADIRLGRAAESGRSGACRKYPQESLKSNSPPRAFAPAGARCCPR